MQESRAIPRSLWLHPALLTLPSGGRRYALLVAAACFIIYFIGFSDIALSSYSDSWSSFRGIGAGGSRKTERGSTQTAWRSEAERIKFAERVNDAFFRYWSREEGSEGTSEDSNGKKDRGEGGKNKNSSSFIIPPTSISSYSTSSAAPRLYRHPIVSCVNHVDHDKVPSDLIDTHLYYRDRLQCYCLDPHEEKEEDDSVSDAKVNDDALTKSTFSVAKKESVSSQLFFPSPPRGPPPRSCILRARKAIIYKPKSPKGKGWAQQPRAVKGTVRAKEPWWSLRAFKTYPQYNEIIIGAPDETRSFIFRIDVPFSSSGISSDDSLRTMHNSPSNIQFTHFDEENKKHLTYFEQPLFVRSVWGGGTKVDESRSKGTAAGGGSAVRVTAGNPLASLAVTHDYRRHPTLLIPTAFPLAPSTFSSSSSSSSSSATTEAKAASVASTLYAFQQTIEGPSSAMAVLTTRLILDGFYRNEDDGKDIIGGGRVGSSELSYVADGDHKSQTSPIIDLQTYPYRFENAPPQTQVTICNSNASSFAPHSSSNGSKGEPLNTLLGINKLCRGMSESLSDRPPPAQCGRTADYHYHQVGNSKGKEKQNRIEEYKEGGAVSERRKRCSTSFLPSSSGEGLSTYITPEILVLDSFHDRFRRSMTAENAVNGEVTYENAYSHLKALEWWSKGTWEGGGGGLSERNCGEALEPAALAGFCQHYLEEASVTATEDLWVGAFSGQMSGLVAGSDKRGISGAKAVRRSQAIFNYEQHKRMAEIAWRQQQLDASRAGEKKGNKSTVKKQKTKLNTTCAADSIDLNVRSLSPSSAAVAVVPRYPLLERFAALCPLSQGQRVAFRHALRQMRQRVDADAEGSVHVLWDLETKAPAKMATAAGSNATRTSPEDSTRQEEHRSRTPECHVPVINNLPQASSLGKHICPMIVKSSSSKSASAVGTSTNNTNNTTEATTNSTALAIPLEHLVLHALVMPLNVQLLADGDVDGKRAPKSAARRADPLFSFATSITETLNSKKRMRRRKEAAGPVLSDKGSGGISKQNSDLLERFNKIANGGLACKKGPSSSLSQANLSTKLEGATVGPPADIAQENNVSSGPLARLFEGILGSGKGGQSNQVSGGLRSTSTEGTEDKMHSNDSDLLTAAAASIANATTTVQLWRMSIQEQIRRLRGVNLLVVADDAAGEVATWAYLLSGGVDGRKHSERGGGGAAIWASGNPVTIVLLTNATLFADTSGALLIMRAPELNPNVRVIAFIYQQGRLPSFAKLREAYDRPWRAETILIGCECETTRVALYKDLEPLC